SKRELHHARSRQGIGVLAKTAGSVNRTVLQGTIRRVKANRVRYVVHLPAEIKPRSSGNSPGLSQSQVDAEISRPTNVVAASALSRVREVPVCRDEITWINPLCTGEVGKDIDVAVAIRNDSGFRSRPIQLSKTVELPVCRKVESVLHCEWEAARP